MEEKLYIQNDGMYLDHEKKEAWFVDRNNNILHKINLENMELQYECNLNTDKENPYRRNPLCYKKGQTIVIFPDRGEKILFYDERKKIVNEYKVEMEGNARVGIYCFGELGDLIWAVSYGMQQIFLIDTKLKKIVRHYKLFRMDDRIEIGFESILNGDSIFCVSRNSNFVSQTDIVGGQEKIYELPVEESGFNTIHYDGECFWLSSMRGNIYIWDIRNNTIEQVYARNGTSYRSVRVGNIICFLPFNLIGNLCDELLCCRIEEKSCSLFEINGQRKEGVYAFEYVKDNNIIGISHSENNFITEINIENGVRNMVCFKASERYFEEKRIDEVKLYMKKRKMLYESNECDITLYLKII